MGCQKGHERAGLQPSQGSSKVAMNENDLRRLLSQMSHSREPMGMAADLGKVVGAATFWSMASVDAAKAAADESAG